MHLISCYKKKYAVVAKKKMSLPFNYTIFDSLHHIIVEY